MRTAQPKPSPRMLALLHHNFAACVRTEHWMGFSCKTKTNIEDYLEYIEADMGRSRYMRGSCNVKGFC